MNTGKRSFRPPIQLLDYFDKGMEPDGQSLPYLFHFEPKLKLTKQVSSNIPPPLPGFATVGAPNLSDRADWLALLLRKGRGYRYHIGYRVLALWQA
ncbi:hypothetical protein PsAD14_01317 [Pseudovibrio sp. Ad14]|nr:hypothetical protein PsW74_04103 [Pseudovibrio sp. W74]KZL10410.1 hypothetical protein PsAD14_01317 [Pseudovibrio sp. Ad14]